MMITPESKSIIPFRPHDAKRVGKGCYMAVGSTALVDLPSATGRCLDPTP
jgi:hypothetical protein